MAPRGPAVPRRPAALKSRPPMPNAGPRPGRPTYALEQFSCEPAAARVGSPPGVFLHVHDAVLSRFEGELTFFDPASLKPAARVVTKPSHWAASLEMERGRPTRVHRTS